MNPTVFKVEWEKGFGYATDGLFSARSHYEATLSHPIGGNKFGNDTEHTYRL